MPEEKRYSVEVLPDAQAKIEGHVEFLARVNEAAAWRLYHGLRRDFLSLEIRPERFKVYEPLSPVPFTLHEMISQKRYRVVYEIDDGMVYIYDVQDCRQDTDKSLV